MYYMHRNNSHKFGGFINRNYSYKLKLVVENYSWLLASVQQKVISIYYILKINSDSLNKSLMTYLYIKQKVDNTHRT